MLRPSTRYASADGSRSRSSGSISPSAKKLSSLGARPIGDHSGGSSSSSSRALARVKPGEVAAAKNGRNLGSMVKRFVDKRSKTRSDPAKAAFPLERVVEDLKKTAAAAGSSGKVSNLAILHRKLFQKGKSGDGAPLKALTEAKCNTRTLAMVLRSERELLDQAKEYEAEILELRSLMDEKEREMEKLKDLCLKQRQEIKALKDAILFPDVMNAQLQMLLEKQGSELKQAKQVIPVLQKQVSSLTGQLQCLADDLAEVKADKYSTRSCFDDQIISPRTPVSDLESANSSECGFGDQMIPSNPDDMFLKDLNPCLTPGFPKMKSNEYDEMVGYNFSNGDVSFESSILSNSGSFFSSSDAKLSKSSENCRRPMISSTTRKTHKFNRS